MVVMYKRLSVQTMPLSATGTGLKNYVRTTQNINGQDEENHSGACCAIKMHSITRDVAALCYDLQNGIWHYFGGHRQCRTSFCKHITTDKNIYNIT